MDRYLDTILQITAEAQEIPRRYFRNPLAVQHKSDDSPVTEADKKTESFIREALEKHFPDHGIFGEEFGQKTGTSDYLWVIDPIDGTRSFISGMPLYGMLIALLIKGKPTMGIVRMPELDEVYHATPKGAFLNQNTPISVSQTTRLSDAFIYINEAHKILADHPSVFASINGSARDQRFAFDVYPHMLVAAGHIDACIDYDLQPYDFLAFEPIIRAAGGVVTDWDGMPLHMQSDGRVLCAATPQLHRQMLALLTAD